MAEQAVRAYVLIQTSPNAAHVAHEIRSIEGVEVADDVSGPYDVIARVEAPDIDALGQLVVSGIQSVEGITRTLTCPVVLL
ncbi:MAG: Lrp/AsnC ligand binding domain-containing protein [Actinomycetota bacterium]